MPGNVADQERRDEMIAMVVRRLAAQGQRDALAGRTVLPAIRAAIENFV
jgi:hypothetical protein